jgi:hypothetical protein
MQICSHHRAWNQTCWGIAVIKHWFWRIFCPIWCIILSIVADNGVYTAVNHWPKCKNNIFLRSYTYQQTKWLKDMSGNDTSRKPAHLAPSGWHFSWAFPSRVTLPPHLCNIHWTPVCLHWAISQFHACHEQPRQHFNPEPKLWEQDSSRFIDSLIPKIWGLEKWMSLFTSRPRPFPLQQS